MTTAAAASASPSSSSTTTTATTNSNSHRPNPNPNPSPNPSSNPMQSWWESISKARSRILSLSSLLSSPHLAALADSDRPAHSLLSSADAYHLLSAALALPSSGSGDDPLCQWLYETFQSSDPDLRLVVLAFVPLLSGLYLSRIIAASSTSFLSPSLAGFEAVLLALYAAETKARGGKPLLIAVPDLSQPSLYHTPRPNPNPRSSSPSSQQQQRQPSIGVLSPPLEPQIAVKSTKRSCIVAVALDCYYKKISLMPTRSKLDLCEFAVSWAGQDCPCRFELDSESNSSSFSSSPEIRNFSEEDGEIGGFTEEMDRLGIREKCNGDSRGSRVPLPWELLQPVLRILGHCLLAPRNSQEVRDAASAAVRCVYARALHDLMPQAILASRSLIQLDKGTRKAEAMVAGGGMTSNPNTPSKPKKPEVLLVSK